MADATELLAQKSALESENNALKNVIESLSAEKIALSQTVTEIVHSNINLKAMLITWEKKFNLLNADFEAAKKEIETLKAASDQINDAA